jgi:hypothetical protein
MLTVIKVAASSEDEVRKLIPDHARAPSDIRAAAVFFLQQVLFAGQGDHYRVLGLTSGAAPEEVREHKRWLLKWLHPDRNNNAWESSLFLRVSQAAEQLETGRPVVPPQRPAVHSHRSAHRKPSRRMASYAARRQRQPLSFRSWLKRQVRRLAIATAAFLAGYIAIKGLGGEPLQDSLSTLAGGPGSWFGR